MSSRRKLTRNSLTIVGVPVLGVLAIAGMAVWARMKLEEDRSHIPLK